VGDLVQNLVLANPSQVVVDAFPLRLVTIPDLDWVAWPGRKVVIAYDAGAIRKDLVRIARSELAAHLRSRGALVGFLEWEATAPNSLGRSSGSSTSRRPDQLGGAGARGTQNACPNRKAAEYRAQSFPVQVNRQCQSCTLRACYP